MPGERPPPRAVSTLGLSETRVCNVWMVWRGHNGEGPCCVSVHALLVGGPQGVASLRAGRVRPWAGAGVPRAAPWGHDVCGPHGAVVGTPVW